MNSEERKSSIEEEMKAIAECVDHLSALDRGAQARIMRYLIDRLGLVRQG